jgi:adenosyl cobinamide kinase/adenosyl cobinamide phosphate guanylyltransferase
VFSETNQTVPTRTYLQYFVCAVDSARMAARISNHQLCRRSGYEETTETTTFMGFLEPLIANKAVLVAWIKQASHRKKTRKDRGMASTVQRTCKRNVVHHRLSQTVFERVSLMVSALR